MISSSCSSFLSFFVLQLDTPSMPALFTYVHYLFCSGTDAHSIFSSRRRVSSSRQSSVAVVQFSQVLFHTEVKFRVTSHEPRYTLVFSPIPSGIFSDLPYLRWSMSGDILAPPFTHTHTIILIQFLGRQVFLQWANAITDLATRTA